MTLKKRTNKVQSKQVQNKSDRAKKTFNNGKGTHFLYEEWPAKTLKNTYCMNCESLQEKHFCYIHASQIRHKLYETNDILNLKKKKGKKKSLFKQMTSLFKNN